MTDLNGPLPWELTTRKKLANVAWQNNLCDEAVEEIAVIMRDFGATELLKSAILKRCCKKPHKEKLNHFSLTDYIIDAIKQDL